MSIARVTQTEDVTVHELEGGNRLRGLATEGLRSTEVALWQHVAEAGGGSPRHWHDHDQVIYIISGKGRIIVGENEHEVAAGDVVIAPARIQHEVHAAPDRDLDTIVAMIASLRSFRPDGSEIDTPWHR